MSNIEQFHLKRQLSLLKHIAKDYSGKTIDNIIQQIESRIKEFEK